MLPDVTWIAASLERGEQVFIEASGTSVLLNFLTAKSLLNLLLDCFFPLRLRNISFFRIFTDNSYIIICVFAG